MNLVVLVKSRLPGSSRAWPASPSVRRRARGACRPTPNVRVISHQRSGRACGLRLRDLRCLRFGGLGNGGTQSVGGHGLLERFARRCSRSPMSRSDSASTSGASARRRRRSASSSASGFASSFMPRTSLDLVDSPDNRDGVGAVETVLRLRGVGRAWDPYQWEPDAIHASCPAADLCPD